MKNYYFHDTCKGRGKLTEVCECVEKGNKKGILLECKAANFFRANEKIDNMVKIFYPSLSLEIERPEMKRELRKRVINKANSKVKSAYSNSVQNNS